MQLPGPPTLLWLRAASWPYLQLPLALTKLFMNLFDKIPTVLTVAVLVGIFAGLKRHSRSARLRLWQIAWFLVFAHFVAQLFEPASGSVSPLLLAADLTALQASAVVFVVSVS